MSDDVICPECNAINPPNARECWLCHRKAWRTAAELGQSQAVEPAAPIMARLVESTPLEAPSAASADYHIGVVLVAVVAVVVILGLFPFAPGAAIAVAVVCGLALAVMVRHGMPSKQPVRAAPRPAGAHTTGPRGATQLAPDAPLQPQYAERRTNPMSIVAAVLGSIMAVFGVLAIIALFTVLSAVVAFLQMCGMVFGVK